MALPSVSEVIFASIAKPSKTLKGISKMEVPRSRNLSSGLRPQPPPGHWGSPDEKEEHPKSCNSFVIPLGNLQGSFACSLYCNHIIIGRDICI